MAIAFDAASNSANQSDTTSFNWNHTCAGAQRFLVVGVGWAGSGINISSVTYAGAAMTQGAIFVSGTEHVALYYKIAPATGTNQVVVNFSGAGANAGCHGGAASFTGVDQVTGKDAAYAGATGSANPSSNDMTSILNNCFAVDCIWFNSDPGGTFAIRAANGQTQDVANEDGTSGTGLGISHTTNPITPAGAKNFGWNHNGSTWYATAMSFFPSPTNIVGPFPTFRPDLA